MKTVIQELIEELKANDVAHGMYWIKRPSDFFEKYLEKEKEQIINSHLNSQSNFLSSFATNTNEAEDYYNQTYNQEETLEEWKSKFTHHCAIKTNKNK